MNCQSAREHFAELLDQRSASGREAPPRPAQVEAARTHLAGCPDCQREFASLSQVLSALDSLPAPAPTPKLRQGFYAMLEEEKHSAASVMAADSQRRRRNLAIWRWILSPIAACALAFGGYMAGRQSQPKPVATTPAAAVADNETKRELQELRAKVDRMETMNQLIAASFAQQQQRPANDRLNAVMTSATQTNPNDQVITELITSLALDPSVNVRLRALDALYAHADRDVVRAAVLASLSREANPVVQVAMIDFLAAARDRDAKPALEKMAVSQLTDGNVREAAKRAIAQL